LTQNIASSRRLLGAASALAISTTFVTQVHAQQSTPEQTTSPTQERPAGAKPLRTGIPRGFEDVDASLRTEFDLTFQDRRLGSFEGVLKDGLFTFEDPAAVARAIGDAADQSAVQAFLSKPLASNEQFRCRPGQGIAIGCGLLPNGGSGVIVDADTFSVTLFLPRELLIQRQVSSRLLGDPAKDFSLIQNIQMSAASAGGQGRLSYGGTFTTLASVGRTALVARTTLTDVFGARSEELYAQHIWGERRAAAGLLQDFQSLTLNSYRMIGGEFGSFFGTLVDPAADNATPIEVLLPKRAQVEVYRFGVLVSSGPYEAGLQLIDTRSLPDGSYAVRVVARDGNQILLDQTRTFSRLSSAVPLGKTGFRFRVGTRVNDTFSLTAIDEAARSLFPKTTGELVTSASAQHRFKPWLASGLTVTTFGDKAFGEATLEVTRGRLSGVIGAGGGSGGTYSAVMSGGAQFERFSVYLSARRTRVGDATPEQLVSGSRYSPFFANQDLIFGSVQAQALGGSISLNGSYTRSQSLPDRHAAAIQYTRSLQLPRLGNVLLTAGASRSNFDTRVGISVSFFKRADRKTSLAFNAGGQYLSNVSAGGGRAGVSPVASVSMTRYEQVGGVDLAGELGASTDADSDRAIARVIAASRVGTGDVSAQWQSRAFGERNLTYQANLQTGFAIGGGAIKLGLRNPADSMVLVDLSRAPAVPSGPDLEQAGNPVSTPEGDAPDATSTSRGGGEVAPPRKVAEGGYRVTVDGQAYDFVGPGGRTAIGLQPLREYSVGLRPQGAPEFDLDATQRPVVLFPGNVARVRFEAQRVITIFGQAVDAAGKPLAGARVEAGNDVAQADDRGFFTITAPLAATVTVRLRNGAPCVQRRINALVDARQPAILYRFGQVACEAGVVQARNAGAKAPPASDIEASVAPDDARGKRPEDEAPVKQTSENQWKNPTKELLAIARADLARLDAILNG